MIKCSGAGCSRYHQERGTYRTRSTVRRLVQNLELVFALLLCNEGRGSTTVKVNCFYASCIKEDLCDFLHATAARIRLLTTVKYHNYNLTGSCNTDSSSGCTIIGVSLAMSNNYFTISNKHLTEATNCFSNLILINSVILILGSYNSLTILGNTKESAVIDTMPFCAIHYEQATGLSGRHVVTVGIGTNYYVIVRNVIGTFGVAVLVLCGISLIKNTLHCPTVFGSRIVIVCKYVNVVTCDVGSCNIVNHLLTICRFCLIILLSNTGC